MGRTDGDKKNWMVNFHAKLLASSASYMVGSADVTAIGAAVDSYSAALAVVSTATGRNPGTTAAKNDARDAAAAICRQYARLIKFNAGISDSAKIAAGIKPPVFLPVPRPCPLTAPTLSITAATNGAHTLLYSNDLDPTARRKPEGADGVVLFRAVATGAVTDDAQFQFYRKFTTRPMPVFFDPADNGKIATYYARWIGQRGDMSTPSPKISMAIAA